MNPLVEVGRAEGTHPQKNCNNLEKALSRFLHDPQRGTAVTWIRREKCHRVGSEK